MSIGHKRSLCYCVITSYGTFEKRFSGLIWGIGVINLWFGEGRIATKVFPILFVLVSLDDRFQNFLPTISAVNITRAQQDAFTIPELIEAEQRMETGTAEMAVVG